MKWIYKAIDKEGKLIDGEREAVHRYALIEDCKNEGLTLISVEEKEAAAPPPPPASREFNLPWLGISSQSVTIFTRQLADLTEAGVPLTESLRSLKSLEPSPRFAGVLDDVYSSIMSGVGFSESLAKKQDVFPPIYVAMIRIGERSGRLTDILRNLADFRERDEEIRSKIKAALSYPLFTLAFSAFLVYGMVGYILPGFEPIWSGTGVVLSNYPVTEFLLALSRLTKSVVDEVILVAVLVALYLAYRHAMASPEGKYARDSLIFKLPVVRSFAEMSVMARISNTLGILTQSGVNLVAAVELTAETSGNTLYEEALQQVATHLKQGASLTEAFKATDRFPPMLVQIIGIAEHSGNLEEMLPRVAHYYDRQLETALKSVTALVEPATMVLVGGIVFLFVLGVFLPIMGIVRGISSQVG